MKKMVLFLILCSINLFASELVIIDLDYKPIKEAEIVINEEVIGTTNSMGVLELDVKPNIRIQVNHPNFNSKNFQIERSQSRIVIKLSKKKDFEKADLKQYNSFTNSLEFFELNGKKTSSYSIPAKPGSDYEIYFDEKYIWLHHDTIRARETKYASEGGYGFGGDIANPLSPSSKKKSFLTRLFSGKEERADAMSVERSETSGDMELSGVSDMVIIGDDGDYSSLSSSGFSNNNAGQLTAGIINDFAKWELWEDIDQSDLSFNKNIWEIDPQTRYSVIVSNSKDYPVIGANVKLLKNESVRWEAITDNLGRAELWSEIFEEDDYQNYIIQVEYQGKSKVVENPLEFKNGINTINLNVECDEPDKVDIAFVVDATGSMGDEINYLKAELGDIIAKTKDQLPEVDLNLASIFYKDEADEYLVRYIQMTANIETNLDFISLQKAGGGGDYPEAVSTALDIALNKISWRENTINKLLFLVLDAPPQSEKKKQVQELTKLAASKGIRIIPVACSGTDKSTEYLTRSMALATGGRYIFLTDDSGIGGAHIKPTTDEYEVLSLNEAILNTIIDYSKTNSCEIEAEKKEENITYNPDFLDNFYVNASDNDIDANFTQWKIYPNPTRGRFMIEADGMLGRIFIADMRGGVIKEIDATGETEIFISLDGLPSGQYLVMHELESGKMISSRIILMK